jgi:hypothetical protein
VYVVDQANARVEKFSEPVPPLPPPEVGKTANIERVSGTVLVRRPGAARFEPLKEAQQIPIGSVVQAKHGVSRLTTARDLGGGQQTARFFAGRFMIRQRHAQVPVTELDLIGGRFDLCPKGVARGTGVPRVVRARVAVARRKRSRRVLRRLWGDGRGRFRSNGHYASAGVRGTKWLTEDRCDGTLIRVRRGTLRVRDFLRKRTVTVTAGRSYFAERR